MTDLLTNIVNAVPWWIRLLLAIVCTTTGLLVLYFVSLRLGVVIVGAGFVFFMFSGRSSSEKNGYNF